MPTPIYLQTWMAPKCGSGSTSPGPVFKGVYGYSEMIFVCQMQPTVYKLMTKLCGGTDWQPLAELNCSELIYRATDLLQGALVSPSYNIFLTWEKLAGNQEIPLKSPSQIIKTLIPLLFSWFKVAHNVLFASHILKSEPLYSLQCCYFWNHNRNVGMG